MNTMKKLSAWSLGLAMLIGGFFGQAQAATSDDIDIHVKITGAKSVAVQGATTYDYGALAVNISSVSLSSITVRNDSGIFIETYTITGANATSDTGGTDWTLAATAGSDQYALAAQFSDNAPNDVDGDWSQDDLTTSAQTCTENKFGNGTEGEGGSNVPDGADRGLWFRIKTPTTVTDSDQHTVTLTVSVL